METCMQRVRLEGQLVALHRPATAASAVAMTSSVDSYRALVAQGGGGDGPPADNLAGHPVALNGLLMPTIADPTSPPDAVAPGQPGLSPTLAPSQIAGRPAAPR